MPDGSGKAPEAKPPRAGPALAAWVAMTPAERLWVGAILAILLLGLAARWWHLSRERPEPYVPAGLETGRTDNGGESP